MASWKGQGNKKGKQLDKKRPVPQVSPSQSSSNKESWLVWQELQEKISALEAEWLVRQAPQPCEVQPHWSARNAKSQQRAKLKAIANDLMARFAVLETEQQPEGTIRCSVDGASLTPQSRHAEKCRRLSTSVMPETVTTSQDVQKETDDFTPDRLYTGRNQVWRRLRWVSWPSHRQCTHQSPNGLGLMVVNLTTQFTDHTTYRAVGFLTLHGHAPVHNSVVAACHTLCSHCQTRLTLWLAQGFGLTHLSLTWVIILCHCLCCHMVVTEYLWVITQAMEEKI